MLIRIVASVFLCGLVPARGQAVPTPTPSVVYLAHDPAAIDHFRPNRTVIRAMVDRLVLSVTGQPDIVRAWSSLVAPGDKVGIKISAAGGELFATHHDIVDAIVDGLESAGHRRETIIVWDRWLGEIKAAGYHSGTGGYQLLSIPPREGYDAKATFTAPVLGNLVWGDLEYHGGKIMPLLPDKENTSSVSHFSRIIASQVTKIINVPVLSDHPSVGIAGCLYNVTIPNVDNWRRFTDRSGFSGASIAQIYDDPVVGKKVVLNIMDGLLGQYAGGPEAAPNYSVHHATILASKDPVAIDTLALKQLERWREGARLPPIGPLAAHVQIAGQSGLGTGEISKIEVKRVER